MVIHAQDVEHFPGIVGMISALSRDDGELFFGWRDL